MRWVRDRCGELPHYYLSAQFLRKAAIHECYTTLDLFSVRHVLSGITARVDQSLVTLAPSHAISALVSLRTEYATINLYSDGQEIAGGPTDDMPANQ